MGPPPETVSVVVVFYLDTVVVVETGRGSDIVIAFKPRPESRIYGIVFRTRRGSGVDINFGPRRRFDINIVVRLDARGDM